MSRQALGRGLNALIPGHLRDLDADPQGGPARDLAVAEIRPNPYQPRRNFDASELKDLAESIREQGVLQPILVVKAAEGYELVSGERRLRAVQSLGWARIPAVVKPQATPREMAEWAIIENVQRDDLSPLEQAKAYQRLIDEFQLSVEEIAKKVGRERATVANYIRLLKLAPELQELLESGALQMGHARALLAVENEAERKALGLKAAAEGWSVRLVEQAAQAGPAPKAAAPQSKREVSDPDRIAVEERLRRRMGTKVKILPSGKGGKIEIHYYGAEELERLLDLLG
jgi:ParB family chromosome partitioning protein